MVDNSIYNKVELADENDVVVGIAVEVDDINVMKVVDVPNRNPKENV